MFIITYRAVFIALASIFMAASLVAVAAFGLNPSIDFTGGAVADISYPEGRPESAALSDALTNAGFAGFSLRTTGENGYALKTRMLSDEEREALTPILSLNGAYTPVLGSLKEIGPTVGAELRAKAWVAILAVSAAIALYVAFAFRHVSKPVSSWVYGSLTIAALVHDVLVPAGAMALMGAFLGAQADTLFLVALLTILGYSVNDTIVVFDRVREHVRLNAEKRRHEEFELTVGKSLDEVFARSVNTSFTTIISLLALFFFGPAATQDFALILIVGVLAGTYSSLCFAAPLLVVWERWRAARA